jgi:hypothetical protein
MKMEAVNCSRMLTVVRSIGLEIKILEWSGMQFQVSKTGHES